MSLAGMLSSFCLLAAGEFGEGNQRTGGMVFEAPPIQVTESLVAEEASLLDLETLEFLRSTAPLRPVVLLQPTPFLEPRVSLMPDVPASSGPLPLAARLFQEPYTAPSLLRRDRTAHRTFQADLVRGSESGPLSATDLGNLLKKSPAALSTGVQRRTPIVHDPRVRSSRIGALAASGSHWVPARADLDTAVSKIDSRSVRDVLVIPGPYSSLYGPGFQFVDFQLLQSPRFSTSNEMHGQTSVDHNSNGNQWLGRQSLWAGGSDWGLRGSYTHRTGDAYRTGGGGQVAAGYNSREWMLALGRDLRDGSTLEFSLLRLDQTDVQFPGYVFDIDYLKTDGYGVTHIDRDPLIGEQMQTEIWYNHTRFEGNAQSPSKRAQFPFLDEVAYIGFTDVESLSTGYRRFRNFGRDEDLWGLTIGHDLRFIKQELNEVGSGVIVEVFPFPVTDANSPIPRSFMVNPGIFAEYRESLPDEWGVRAGGRLDYVQTDIVDNPINLEQVGFDVFPATYEQIVGTSISQTDRILWSLYSSVTRRHSDELTSSISLGFAQRPPTLTELYAAQPFLLMLQNGLNNVTGDPRLKNEKMLQLDLSADYEVDSWKTGLRGFHGWGLDYITLENTQVITGSPNGDVQQVSLRYVNTDLVTLTGFEGFAEWNPRERWSPFVTVRYVEGRDRTRHGRFATTNGNAAVASTRVAGLPRGFFSGVSGSDAEPLPGISPLETRFGIRLRGAGRDPRWNLEFSARVVDDQDRVASSLLETPTPGFTVLDLRSTLRPSAMNQLLLVGGIENLTDKRFLEHLDFRAPNGIAILQPGINVYFGVDLSY